MNREEIEKVYDQGKEAVVNFVEVLTNRIDKLESQLEKIVITAASPHQVMG